MPRPRGDLHGICGILKRNLAGCPTRLDRFTRDGGKKRGIPTCLHERIRWETQEIPLAGLQSSAFSRIPQENTRIPVAMVSVTRATDDTDAIRLVPTGYLQRCKLGFPQKTRNFHLFAGANRLESARNPRLVRMQIRPNREVRAFPRRSIPRIPSAQPSPWNTEAVEECSSLLASRRIGPGSARSISIPRWEGRRRCSRAPASTPCQFGTRTTCPPPRNAGSRSSC